MTSGPPTGASARYWLSLQRGAGPRTRVNKVRLCGGKTSSSVLPQRVMADLTAAGGEVSDDHQRGARIKGDFIPGARETGRIEREDGRFPPPDPAGI